MRGQHRLAMSRGSDTQGGQGAKAGNRECAFDSHDVATGNQQINP